MSRNQRVKRRSRCVKIGRGGRPTRPQRSQAVAGESALGCEGTGPVCGLMKSVKDGSPQAETARGFGSRQLGLALSVLTPAIRFCVMQHVQGRGPARPTWQRCLDYREFRVWPERLNLFVPLPV